MNLGTRIKTAFELAGVRAPEVSRASNVPVAAINALIRRNSRRSEFTESILAVLPAEKVNCEWVRTGNGSPTPQQNKAAAGAATLNGHALGDDFSDAPGASPEVPVKSWEHPEQWPEGSHMYLPKLKIGMDSSGIRGRKTVITELVKHEVLTFTTGWMKYDQLKPAGLAWSQATDASMETVLFQGDHFVVDTNQKEIVDGKTYVVFYENQQRVRRLFSLPGGRLRIEANNGGKFPTIELSPAEVKTVTIIGKVVHRSGSGGL